MTDVEGLYGQMEALRRQFTGQVPPGLGDHIWVPRPDEALIPGSTAPAVVSEFVQAPSGLFVPRAAAAPAEPLDMVHLYLTGEEVFGEQPPVEWVIQQLQRMRSDDALTFAAQVLAATHAPGMNRHEVDEHFLPQWLVEPTLTRVRNILRDRRRVLVVPQMAHVFLKLAAVFCPAEPDASDPPGRPHAVLLSLPDLLRDDLEEAETVITGAAGTLTRELVANQLFNARPDHAAVVGRYSSRWLCLPTELADDPRVVDLAGLYEEATGAPLGDVMAAAMALFATSISGSPRVNPNFLDAFGWDSERTERAVAVFVADIATLRAAVEQEVRGFGWNWSASSVARYPVARLTNGDLLVLDPSLMIRRAFGWLPLFDIQAGLGPGEPARKRAARAEGTLRHLAEVQALESVRQVVGEGSGRVFTEAELQAVPGRRDSKVCDAVVDYGDAWVLLEVTTTQLRRESVAAMPGPHLDDDLDKLVEKAEQLHEAIETLRVGHSYLTGAEARERVRYLPVLVLAEGFPVNPATLTLLRERVAAAGWLTAEDTARLELMDLEDLDVVEALQEHGGPSFRDLLVGKQAHSLRDVGVKDYVLLGLGRRVRRPERIAGEWNRAMEDIYERLGRTPAEPSEVA